MKPKIALAKYLDWAVLAVLAAALIAAAVWSFVWKTTGEEKLSQEIRDYDGRVQKGMSDTSAQIQPPHDYLADLRSRFEHPAVIDPYRHNPFLAREDIAFPPLQLRVGVPRTVTIKGTRLTQVVTGDEKRMRVVLGYDLPTGVSTVTFTPLEAGETTIRIQTDEDLVHLFKISVRTVKRPPAPNPPINVAIQPRAPIEIGKTLQPAMALIVFSANEAKDQSRPAGLSNNAAVYRKPADSSDAEYVRLDDPNQPLAPLTRDQIHKIMVEFKGPHAAADLTAPAAAPGSRPSASYGRPPEAEAVTSILTPVASEPSPGSFVFLDQTVDDGESYIYKIVTLSTVQDVEPVPCEEPYVSPAPVFVPSLVEFTVRTVTSDRATVRVTRHDPETGELLPPHDFSVGLGMEIGEDGVTLKLPTISGRVPPPPRNADFRTHCILVTVLPAFKSIEYNKLHLVRGADGKYVVVYQAKARRDAQILYLTPRGALHFKGKELAAASPSGAPTPGAPAPGAPAPGAPAPAAPAPSSGGVKEAGGVGQ